MATSLIGWVIGKSVRSVSALFAVTLMTAGSDMASFYFGATRHLIDLSNAGNRLLQLLSFSVPSPMGVLPVIGVGDLVFLFAIYYVLLASQNR